MSGAAPTDVIQWAESAISGGCVDPTTKKIAGWNPGDEPPAEWLNWWQRAVGRWQTYYGSKNVAGGVAGVHDTDGNVQITASTATKPAFVGVGNTTGAGGNFTGGASGGSGVEARRGAGGAMAIDADYSIIASAGNLQATTGQVIANTGLKALVSGTGSDAITGFVSRGSAVPSITTSGGTPTITYQTNRVILWTRINGLVFFQMHLDWTLTGGSGSGFFYITGLPYAIKNKTLTGSTSVGITLGTGFGVGDWGLDSIGAYPGGADTSFIPKLTLNVIAPSGGTAAANTWSATGCYFTDDAF